jgi:hypothetical protein
VDLRNGWVGGWMGGFKEWVDGMGEEVGGKEVVSLI